MGIFCNSVLESLIRYEMTAWFGSLTVNSESEIEKLIKTSMKGKGNKETVSHVEMRKQLFIRLIID